MTLAVQSGELAEVRARLASLGEVPSRVASSIGRLVADQTRERLSSTKSSPDGGRWLPWRNPSDHRGGSLLQSSGDLLRSIGAQVSGQAVEVGSPLPYAAVHQRGSARHGILPREYLGLSPENARDVERLVLRHLEEGLR